MTHISNPHQIRNPWAAVAEVDPEIFALLRQETRRQEEGLELIASENFVSDAVMQTVGSVLTNKYAEGYPGKRYYGGCVFHDAAEQLAIERAKKLFGAEHANVQPHSGASANFAAYQALIHPGDTVLAMRLDQGGHLTHGSPVNFSGKLFNIVGYGVRPDDQHIDYDQVAALAEQHKPKLLVAGASAYPRVIDFARLGEIARSVGALFMVDMAHIAGLVAAGVHPSPVPHADVVTTTTHKTLRGPRGGLILCRSEHQKKIDSSVFPGSQGGPLMHVVAAKAVCLQEALQPSFVEYQKQIVKNAKALAQTFIDAGWPLVSGGTDNHLMMLNVKSHEITGKAAEEILGKVDITVNKNMLPFDTEKPFVTSGIRIGTPAVTSRGMGEDEMRTIGRLIMRALLASKEGEGGQPNTQTWDEVRHEVNQLAHRFPLYAHHLSVLDNMLKSDTLNS